MALLRSAVRSRLAPPSPSGAVAQAIDLALNFTSCCAANLQCVHPSVPPRRAIPASKTTISKSALSIIEAAVHPSSVQEACNA